MEPIKSRVVSLYKRSGGAFQSGSVPLERQWRRLRDKSYREEETGPMSRRQQVVSCASTVKLMLSLMHCSAWILKAGKEESISCTAQ